MTRYRMVGCDTYLPSHCLSTVSTSSVRLCFFTASLTAQDQACIFCKIIKGMSRSPHSCASVAPPIRLHLSAIARSQSPRRHPLLQALRVRQDLRVPRHPTSEQRSRPRHPKIPRPHVDRHPRRLSERDPVDGQEDRNGDGLRELQHITEQWKVGASGGGSRSFSHDPEAE